MDIKPPNKSKAPSLNDNTPNIKEMMGPPPKIEDDVETIDMSTMPVDVTKDPNMPKKRRRLTKKKKIMIAVFALVLIIAGVLVYFFVFKKDVEQPVAKVVEAPKKEEPPKYFSPLTGVEFKDDKLISRPVTGVMVENSPDSRPQSGLSEAGIVFEAIAEAGVTRFLALYQESTPAKVGPVRSARPYYIDYALGFDATYAHVGGSPDALADIKSLGVKDLDEFSNAGTFWRASDRYAPHNAYTAFDRIDKYNTDKGYKKSEFKPLERKIDVPQTPKAASVNFTISGPNYNTSYTYEPSTNSYLRAMAGANHSDAESGKQINPKVLVAIVTDKTTDSDGYHSIYKTTGSGKVIIFQDGIVSEGTWQKTERKSSLELVDKYGLPLKLNAGQTWVTIIGSADEVRYST